LGQQVCVNHICIKNKERQKKKVSPCLQSDGRYRGRGISILGALSYARLGAKSLTQLSKVSMIMLAFTDEKSKTQRYYMAFY
jgi:hypothetical protein